MGQVREHHGREVERFMRENPDKPWSIEEVNEKIGGWTLTSISSVLSRMVERYPEHMERLSRGVYRWNSTAVQPKNASPSSFVMQVLTEQDGIFLCRDSASGKLYRVSEFSLNPS